MTASRGIAKAPILLLVLLVSASPLAPASTSQNDAGLGLDVSDTREAAALVGIPGAYQGSLTPGDVDWYRSNVSSAAPLCANLVATADPEAAIALEITSGGVTTRALTLPVAGTPGRASLAFPSGATVRVEARPIQSGITSYGFELSTVGVPAASAGDALSGRDAGATLGSAIGVSPGCVAGRLSIVNNVVETADLYAISVSQGQQLTYSFAQAAAGRVLRVQLLDGSGNALATAFPSGGAGSFLAPSTGLYFLSVSSSDGSYEEVPYAMGLTVGPPEPGSACRPQC